MDNKTKRLVVIFSNDMTANEGTLINEVLKTYKHTVFFQDVITLEELEDRLKKLTGAWNK